VSTFNAFYVRRKATAKVTRSAVLSVYPNARVEIFDNFIGGLLSGDELEPQEQKLSALSARLETDVIWVTFQTTAGSFAYHHWHSGTHQRALTYGYIKEGRWDRVEGVAEPWEDFFWDKESLERCLELAKSDAERKKLKKLWSDGVLIKGSEVPYPGSDLAVETIMEHYGFGY